MRRADLMAAAIVTAGFAGSPLLGVAANPEMVEFNTAFLRSPVDVRLFAQGNPVAPGYQRIDLYINGSWKGRSEVRFELPTAESHIAQPCYDLRLFELLGLDSAHSSDFAQQAMSQGDICSALEQFMPQSSATFDSGAQRLDVFAPQAVLLRNARGYVSPKLWDAGITAATLQYDYNAYHSEVDGSPSHTSQYLGLRAGLNLGDWRLRYRATSTLNSHESIRYRNSAVYAERGLPQWHSRLMLGEASTNGQVFDSISFLGVQLSSDERMYADSQRGFAPVVRGIANSNARVRISQRGNTIYETTVPPGAFVIDDLYPNGTGGDLLVTVTEADGNEHSFTVTYATTAELLRPGMTHYSLTAGRYRSSLVDDEPMLAMGTWRHGFSNSMTGYGGSVVAEGYLAAAGGVAFNTGLGALAADLTHARTDDDDGRTHNGQSLRLTYAKILPLIDTNVTLASYRYSSNGYYDPTDAFLLRDKAFSSTTIERRRNRFLVSATQSLPEGYGSFALAANTQNYWQRKGKDTEYVLSYNNQIGRISFGASASRSRNLVTDRWDNRFMLSLTIPLSDGTRSPQLSTAFTHERNQQSLQTSLAGSAGRDSQYRYNAFTSFNENRGNGHSTTTGLSGAWAAPYTTVGGSASTGPGYRQYGANLSGGIVAYQGGVVLSPMLGETIGIVEARQATGARVTNYSGVRVDGDGLAVVPYLSPYRRNSVEIDPKGISTDVQLQNTSQHIAPTAGAVALLKFKTEIGYSVLLSGRLPSGEPLPFAAAVFDTEGRNVGYVAQGGQAMLRVLEPVGTMVVKWGEAAEQRCRIDYAFSEKTAVDSLGYRTLEGASCVN
ncbi:hypothetical protein AXE65_02660 [Ventosimonas gracilis]|uniref:Fimbrial protein n=1 Tax=Ventosimonas gracilis TaxID=1680762 RepID=A0A139SUB2_9GAMM|nr:fimbria/pilus outer membrane usher protein [Ventosimonas gracilis]KXU38145.1 hypothetical protein AXE65_02660 [Ventosimonas gracilis]